MENFGMNKNQFSKALGLTNNVTIGRIINEGRTPSFDILEKIIQTFSSINANWLITGKGEMIRNAADDDSKNKTIQLAINDKPASQEQMSKAFTWMVFNNYKSKYKTDIKFDSFETMSKQFATTVELCSNIQETMEMEIAMNMYKFMTAEIKKGKESSTLPDALKDIIEKYDRIYNDFLNESTSMIRIMELTKKHYDTISGIISSIPENKDE